MITIELSRTSLFANSSDSESDTESDSLDPEADGRIIEFAVVQKCEGGERFGDLVEMAKSREAQATVPVSSRAVIDFGLLSFVDRTLVGSQHLEDNTKAAIRHALAFKKDCEFWCKYKPPSFFPSVL